MAHHNAERRERAEKILSKHGYGKMASMAKTAVHEHEAHDHPGKSKTRIKLAHGGCAMGGKPHERLDRKPRAAGGRNKHKEPKVSVNVINAGKQPVPVPVPGGMGGSGMRPPMPPAPPPQARPPMPPPQMPMGAGMRPGMMNAGGRAKRAGGGPVRSKGDHPHLTGGAGGGLGRLEKQAAEARRA